MADTPRTPQRAPYPVHVLAGKTYWWCACGRSQHQPFCDGSHVGTTFTPVEYTPSEDGTLYFCGCNHSGSKPLCDGSHRNV